MRGKCKYCGCTDDAACAQGCSWLDEAHTICSACIQQMTLDELHPLIVAETKLAQGLAMDLTVDSVTAIAVCSALQLALAHPQFPNSTRRVLRKFIEGIREQGFGSLMPAHQETIRRGYADRDQVTKR